ncbi:hypothetical protein [Guptibacillus hwajinpoensis]|uniref:Radical SAM protein n=1 Tax=Guptibacillus hwajinpoensis TaxID=208199 RepID=A0A0J6CME4_9BACL|nr:hypothetical protein [Alkalihalobacillus macyae]KMM37391.1 hypothetical protein AB986_16185 [Alkalihalobacillus macyae]
MYKFQYDHRLQITLPMLDDSWENLSIADQEAILLKWEQIKSLIPDRIAELEQMICYKQAKLSDEANFQQSCLLNTEIADLASIINDLWLWYRKEMFISPYKPRRSSSSFI